MASFYAESLPRISSVSVFVEDDDLQLESITQIDQYLLKVTLSNKSPLFINLPAAVRLLPTIENCYTIRDNTLSIRLPSEQKVADRSTNSLMKFGTTYKWDSRYLQKHRPFQFQCQCGAERLNSEAISRINEMPSELWTEMMDFWHCHKPNDDKTYSERFSSLRPLPGSIITGAYYVAFNLDDEIIENFSDEDGVLYCCKCKDVVGEYDKTSQVEKIFKWTLVLNHNGKQEIFNPFNYIYISLLENVNKNATRVVEYVNQDESLRLLIWVFNVGIDYSVQGFKAQNALKVYYTQSQDSIEQERIDRGEIEQIVVPNIVIRSTIEHLENITKKLPKSLQKMGNRWMLGIINGEQ